MSRDEEIIEKNRKSPKEVKSDLEILIDALNSNKIQNTVLMAEILDKPISKRINRRVRR